jgi:hypothetical protein
MTKKLIPLALLAFLSFAEPIRANLVVEPTYREKMGQSELVVIGTVNAVKPGGPNGSGSTAELSVLQILKGKASKTIIVGTYHPVAELNPRCCEVGATYLMFLRRSVGNGQLVSIRGVFGMVRVGGPPSHYEVIRH